MTGSLLVDGHASIEELIYSPRRAEPRWDRFSVRFTDGGGLVVHDPRLLGGVSLDPDETVLGPDAMTVTPAQLREVLAGSAAPVKARLMDQARLAGVGNLLADEILWRAVTRSPPTCRLTDSGGTPSTPPPSPSDPETSSRPAAARTWEISCPPDTRGAAAPGTVPSS